MSTCTVLGCSDKVVSKGLCNKHRQRLLRHGTTDPTRPYKEGTRDDHPLYGVWSSMRRGGRAGIDASWADFWKFVSDVGVRPSANHMMERLDRAKPYGVGNFYWREKFITSAKTEDQKFDSAKYQREYRRIHPEKSKNTDLKKNYGIDLAEYDKMLGQQSGVCAICKCPETDVHRTKMGDGTFRVAPRKLAVDHCHEKFKVRGLLCARCNTGIGNFRHDKDIVMAAALYLEEHE